MITTEQPEPALQFPMPASLPVPLSSHRPRNIGEWIREKSFPGDDSETMRRIQIMGHFDLMRHLESSARERFLEAADFVGLQNELVAATQGKCYMDPMPLMEAYARIAAYYRFTNSQAKQMELGQDRAAHWNATYIAWVRFYESEVQRFTAIGEITRTIVKVVVHADTEAGRLAQDDLDNLLEDRYGNLEMKARRIHRAGPVTRLKEEV